MARHERELTSFNRGICSMAGPLAASGVADTKSCAPGTQGREGSEGQRTNGARKLAHRSTRAPKDFGAPLQYRVLALVAYSATTSPDPPNSAGKSRSFGRPSRIGSTVSA